MEAAGRRWVRARIEGGGLVSREDGRDVDFGGAAIYRIVVQGALSDDWSERLGGLTITVAGREGEAPRTTLVGAIRDQAQLSGVLDTLYGLHMPILNVERLEGME